LPDSVRGALGLMRDAEFAAASRALLQTARI
jgi:hypothetical protein